MEQLNQIINPKFSGNSGSADERSSESVILNDTLRKYIYESPYIIGFIQTIMFDYRHVLSKRDVYEFMQSVFTCEFLLSKVDIQKVLEEIIKSIKDLKDAFEVFMNQILVDDGYLLQKQSTLQMQQYEFKISVLFGNTVIVYFILSLCSLNESVKSHLKNLIMQIHDYFRNKVVEIKMLLTNFENQQKQQQEQLVDTNNSCSSIATGENSETAKSVENNDQQPKKAKYDESQQSINNLQQKFFESLLQKLIPILQYMTNSINIPTPSSSSSPPPLAAATAPIRQNIGSDLETTDKK